ncbi:MAG: hypothetical protein WKF82_02475 [Nocardioidaceae bacterium]
MFRRHTSSSGDAVAAAQRRLAALAAQFETAAPARRDESTGVDATTPADSADSAEPGRHAARVNAVKEYGRWELTAHHVIARCARRRGVDCGDRLVDSARCA